MSKLKLIGKNILVGITYLDESGDVEKQIELHGKIITFTKSCLIFKNSHHNDEFSIPFDEENLQPSPPDAIYRLKSTGEEVDRIDFLTTWTVYPSEKK